jgi:hypothetical protein
VAHTTKQQDKNKKAYFFAAPDRLTAEQWMDAIKTQQTPIPTPSGIPMPSISTFYYCLPLLRPLRRVADVIFLYLCVCVRVRSVRSIDRTSHGTGRQSVHAPQDLQRRAAAQPLHAPQGGLLVARCGGAGGGLVQS